MARGEGACRAASHAAGRENGDQAAGERRGLVGADKDELRHPLDKGNAKMLASAARGGD